MTYLDQEAFGGTRRRCAIAVRAPGTTEASEFLLRIVATLPPRQQEVLQLKFQNDLSYQEISEITKLSVSNVGVIIHNALKTLRQRYAEESKDFIPFKTRTA